MSRVLGLFFLLLWARPGAAQRAAIQHSPEGAADETNTIDVWAKRTEITHPNRAGQSVIIRPEDETRFDTRVHLRSEASLSIPETGRINASGFALPRVRGQDSRFTEIYLDGMKVQDPYVGFPIVDDLDLRAWGELQIYVGNPPPSLPTVTPNGALSYKIHVPAGQKHQFGMVSGRPYGHAFWGVSRYKSPSRNEVQLYLRRHTTDGEFSYHDDRATPYNTSDDKMGQRRNGDRLAYQALPTFSWQSGSHKISGLGIWNQSNTGLPSRNSDTVSTAREDGRYRVGKLAYHYSLKSAGILSPVALGMEAGAYDLTSTTSDPTQVVIGPTQTTNRQVNAVTAAGFTKWQWSHDDGDSSLMIRPEIADVRIDSKTSALNDLVVLRKQEVLYSGLDLALPFAIHLEAKGSLTKLRDLTAGSPIRETGNLPQAEGDSVLPGSSLGLAWQTQNTTFYAQTANLKRPPTLLEKYGDGGIIRDNPALSPEKTLHREVGLRWQNVEPSAVDSSVGRCQIRSALFRDDTWDRIILLPSIAQTLRAQNAVETDITGAEMAFDLAIWQTTLTGGYARLWPWDHSYKSRSRLVPGVAEHVATASLSQITPWATFRLASRYQSQVWRDSENSIAIPGYLIHDVTIDATWHSLAFGVAVYNVTDKKRLPIYATGKTASSGDTSYSDYAGMPLPGRNWRFSVAATF